MFKAIKFDFYELHLIILAECHEIDHFFVGVINVWL